MLGFLKKLNPFRFFKKKDDDFELEKFKELNNSGFSSNNDLNKNKNNFNNISENNSFRELNNNYSNLSSNNGIQHNENNYSLLDINEINKRLEKIENYLIDLDYKMNTIGKILMEEISDDTKRKLNLNNMIEEAKEYNRRYNF